MRVVSPTLIHNKKVLLRMDLDVPIVNGKVTDDFRLLSGMDTLEMCLKHSESVVVLGHVGRPEGREVEELSVKPIVEWFEKKFAHKRLASGKFHILENLRFESGEEGCDIKFAQELAGYGDFFVNEAFASHHKSASTTLLPKLLPSAAGLHFAKEVQELKHIKNNPKRPFVAIVGGAKVEDKLRCLNFLSR